MYDSVYPGNERGESDESGIRKTMKFRATDPEEFERLIRCILSYAPFDSSDMRTFEDQPNKKGCVLLYSADSEINIYNGVSSSMSLCVEGTGRQLMSLMNELERRKAF